MVQLCKYVNAFNSNQYQKLKMFVCRHRLDFFTEHSR